MTRRKRAAKLGTVITKAQLLGAAEVSARGNAAHPFTQAAIAAIGADLAAGAAAWWPAAEAAWQARHFADADQALHLVWSAMHYEALSGHPLGKQLLTCGGEPSGALGQAVREFLAAPPAGFQVSLASRWPRVFSPFWAKQWLDPARLFFQRRKLPYTVVELNSPGGLGTCIDLLTLGHKGFDSALVEARLGLDQRPLDLRKDDDAKWLIACCLPDESPSVRASAAGARKLRGLLAEDEALVQLADCAPALAPAFIAKNLPPDPEAGLLVFSTSFLRDLGRQESMAAAQALGRALGAWDDRALWVAVEPRVDPSWIDVVVKRRQGDLFVPHLFRSVRFAPVKSSLEHAENNAKFLAA